MSQTTSVATSGHESDPDFLLGDVAQELHLKGQMSLIKGFFDEGCRYFNEACEHKSSDPKIYYEQGLSLFEYGTEEGQEKTLLLASKKFKLAVSLLPEYFEAWLAWGMSLAYLGSVQKRHHFFLEAKDKLKKALALSKGREPDMLADLHREYAQVRVEIAQNSKEAHDWYLAMDHFEKASTLGNQTDPEFWNQFGFASFCLASQVNDMRLCVKAVHHFKHAITYEPANYRGWKLLTESMTYLYGVTHDEDHFSQASDCFTTCVQIHPLADEIWSDWAQFLLHSGRSTSDAKRVKLAVEKSMKALALREDNLDAAICKAEALAYLGELSDHMDYIQQGQDKLFELVEFYPRNSEVWRALGESYVSMGNYFQDYDYLYQAVEKFQQGLSIDRSLHKLWFAMGKSYALAGSFLQDVDSLHQAEEFFLKAISLCSKSSIYHFEYAVCLAKLGEFTQEERFFETAIREFEQVLQKQKNALYLHPDWLFEYAKTLDQYAEFFDEERYYQKAIEIFSHILMIDPDFPLIHYHLALSYSHLGELSGEIEPFYRALHSFKLALKHEEENDQILVDMGVTLINIAQNSSDSFEVEVCYRDAEVKLMQAVKSGNLQGYYQLACLFSLTGQLERSMKFLRKTESFQALPEVEDLMDDEWLDRVRNLDEFKEFVAYLEEKAHQHEEL